MAHQDGDKISVLLGSAGGSFTGPTDFGLFSHANPLSVALGEFNGDSHPDLAVANEGSSDGTTPGNVSVLLGAAGGTFGAPTNFAAGTRPQSVAVGHFNGDSDSDPDLAVANEGGNVSVLLGGTGGSFGTATDFPAGITPRAVGVGDFNGDLRADIAVANKDSDNVSVLLGAGGGSIGAPTNFPAGTTPHSIAVGEFNGDSDPDLVVVNEVSHGVSVLLGGSGSSFGTATYFPAGNLPDAVAVGELNRDSDPDIVVANQASDNVSVLLGGTGGSFGTATNFPAGDAPTAVELGDFNGDPGSDIVVTNELSNLVAILLATPPETTIDSGPLGLTNDSTPAFTFSSEANATFQCRLDGPGTTVGSYSVCSSPKTYTSALADGSYTFSVRATDDQGLTDPTPASSTFTVDTVPPPVPSLTATDPTSPANHNSPKVKGTAEVGSTVNLYKAATTSDCTPANLAATGTVADFASPGLTASVADNSSTRFRATATDAAGNTSACSTSSRVYVEDSTPPGKPGLTATDPASPANHNSPKVKGTGAANTTVNLYKAATTSDCTPANLAAAGTTAEFGSTGLTVSVPDNSSTRFRATATDAAGNTSACSTSSRVYVEDSIAPGPPGVTATDPPSPANNTSPKVRGNAAANTTVNLYKAATTSDCTPANLAATGTAADFASPGLTASVADNSSTRFRATATDAAGNTSACSTSSKVYVEDSTPPGKPTLTATDPASPANQNSPKVKGTAAAGTTIDLYTAATTADCTPANLAATGTAAEFASPGLQVSVFDNSSTRFRATATDAAGNTSACSTSSIVYVEDSSL